MSAVKDTLDQINQLGFTLEGRSDKLEVKRPAGCSLPPELADCIRAHKAELLKYLSGHAEMIALEGKARRTNKLTYEESDRLQTLYKTVPMEGSVTI